MIKESLKRNILIAMSAVVVPVMAASACNMNVLACEIEAEDEDVPLESGVARSPIIEHRYKMIDGVLYWRLYNYSDGCWIGDWEPVPIDEP